MVFVEMLRRNLKPGLELFYYRTRNDKEVDFVCRTGHKVTTLIQVCFDISDAKTLKREISALLETGNELSCDHFQILTWDRETVLQEQNATITVLPVWKWLLSKSVEV